MQEQDVVDLYQTQQHSPPHSQPNKMEEQKQILQRSHDPLSADPVAAGNRSAAVRDDWRVLLINSLVLAAMIPALLQCTGGGDLLVAAWSLSLFAVSCLFYCTCFFSTTDTPVARIFINLFYVGLLAFFARNLLSPLLGMVIMYLDSLLAAGLFGATLAQHRQSNGTDTAALVAVAKARVKPESRHPAYMIIGFFALCCLPRLVWLMLVDSPAFDVAVGLFGAIGFVQVIHISCVIGWLNGAVFNDSVPIFFYFICVAYLFACAYVLMGEIVGVTVLWLCILASTAFLGYYHQIYTSYEEMIMSMELPSSCETATPLEDILVV